MLEQGDLRLELMSSKAAAEYLGENDLAVLPIGCIEMHGPHVPLGCDLMIAWGTSVLLARKWGAVLMPPISYAYPGASGPWPGTVNVRPEATITWIKEVALSIVRGGFKRLVLCAVHAPLNWMLQVVVRSLYQEHGVIVAAFSPYGRVTQRIKAEFGRGGEDAYVLGALRILGLHGAFRPETDVELIADRSGEASVALGEARASVPCCSAPRTTTWRFVPTSSSTMPTSSRAPSRRPLTRWRTSRNCSPAIKRSSRRWLASSPGTRTTSGRAEAVRLAAGGYGPSYSLLK